MRLFERIHAIAAPMNMSNIDTDQIVPGRFMHKQRENYGRYCFHDLRFDADGRPRPEFVLNCPAFRQASILVAGTNFGCGSSREQAVFALDDFGFRTILAPSFGEIFFNNCLKNGVLPVVLPTAFIEHLFTQLDAAPGAMVSVNLPLQQVTAPDGCQSGFDINGFHKECLRQGLDDIERTLSLRAQIDQFEASHFIYPVMRASEP